MSEFISLRCWSISFWTFSETDWPLVACAIACNLRMSICFITESTSLCVWATSSSCLTEASVGGGGTLGDGDGDGDGLPTARTNDEQRVRMRSTRINMAIVKLDRRWAG